ncbi:fatty acid desaturase [Exiguobacterium profundum]|uniref:fatty acid desaturase n=1 Tax=Exiguobacterium TaxID=33986 RepID=UPI00093C324E|nr:MULTISPECIES: fatty acid desaturase [Exiguobacterium]QPI68043.1 fatty acid desaturase [Exiguobacterium sp. PBE]MBG0918125.1 fatty acid desaturase [Exiguobacterium sp. SRB7LM]MCT4799672.1 fatty acid desaturase [Exiguobacterium profundum]MDT0192664.1 fatty acid desaturase [Exiguobacterium sp. BG5(2022)]VXB67828.1 fatty acid desaturase [Exiguobacterium sp. 8A]
MSKEKIAQLRKHVSPFEKSDIRISVRQMINTILPFLVSWFLAYQLLSVSIFLTLPFTLIAAGFVVRMFIIFHDCTHGSFFKNKKANAIVGTITGVLTLFPYEKWKREHAIHHASSGNLDKRGVGDIWVMTIEEYIEASKWTRLKYRLYRHPLVMFGLGPLWLILVTSRFNRKDARKKERQNTYLINISLVVLYSALIYLIGWQAFLIVQGTTMFIAGVLGIWLFYVQHTFEDSYFEDEQEWDYVKAAIEGSSYYELPKVLQWVTGNIGFHHVHHLSPRVPNYHLEKAHTSTPPLQRATTIGLFSSLKSLRYKLYDANNKTFVTFREVRHLLRRANAA